MYVNAKTLCVQNKWSAKVKITLSYGNESFFEQNSAQSLYVAADIRDCFRLLSYDWLMYFLSSLIRTVINYVIS